MPSFDLNFEVSMITGFIQYGVGWGLIWQAQGKAASHSVLSMPLWCKSGFGQMALILPADYSLGRDSAQSTQEYVDSA